MSLVIITISVKIIYLYGYIRLNVAVFTVVVKDKNFRITIPEGARLAEDIKVMDIIEVKVKNITKKGAACRQEGLLAMS